jgi:hypothetical protein
MVRTAAGRATIAVLPINLRHRSATQAVPIAEGVLLPASAKAVSQRGSGVRPLAPANPHSPEGPRPWYTDREAEETAKPTTQTQGGTTDALIFRHILTTGKNGLSPELICHNPDRRRYVWMKGRSRPHRLGEQHPPNVGGGPSVA